MGWCWHHKYCGDESGRASFSGKTSVRHTKITSRTKCFHFVYLPHQCNSMPASLGERTKVERVLWKVLWSTVHCLIFKENILNCVMILLGWTKWIWETHKFFEVGMGSLQWAPSRGGKLTCHRWSGRKGGSGRAPGEGGGGVESITPDHVGKIYAFIYWLLSSLKKILGEL